MTEPTPTTETATLGGGCFWCLEACFEVLRGVSAVTSGYAGGDPARTDYKSVCEGNTGHAEVVRVTFDPTVLAFRDILDIFFAIHDPTTLNRQGVDVGTQYRSVVFYNSAEQKATVEATIKELDADQVWTSPIVTTVEPATDFHPAEEYHREYFRNNPSQPYCQRVVAPKAAKMVRKFSAWLK